MSGKRIAVIGGGIAGAGAAWLLSQHHHVTLFEAAERIGGHTHTIDVNTADGPVAVDTGFMVFNQRNYPNLTALFDHLGVSSRASDMSFSCADRGDGVEYSGDNLDTLFAQRRNLLRPGFLRMCLDILRFNRDARSSLRAEASGDDSMQQLSLGEYLERMKLGGGFRDRYLLPMAAAIWSCPRATMLDFPALRFLRFLENHGLLDLANRPVWRTVIGGSREYMKKLVPHIDSVRLGCPVREVERTPDDVALRGDTGELGRFDEVVFACHADQALAILKAPRFWESTLLSQFRFQANDAVLHRDERVMPMNRRVWASWNHTCVPDSTQEAPVAVTYWLNRLQAPPTSENLFVTLNPVETIRDDRVVQRIRYTHPVLDQRANGAQRALPWIQGRDRLWFCGAWTGYGFHEDGLRSAIRVAQQLGCQPPWEAREAHTAPHPAPAFS